MYTPYYQNPENREEDLSRITQRMLADVVDPSDVFATMWKVFLDLSNDPQYNTRTQKMFRALYATAYLAEFIEF